MFVAERLDKIREILIAQNTVNISTLCSLLEVSDVTVRKDLETLEKTGFLKKIHGGAVLKNAPESSTPSSNPAIPFYEEKLRIAETAAKLIEEYDNIFIGPGTSCYIFSKMLYKHNNIRVFTNNVNSLEMLYTSVKKVNVLGGEIMDRDRQMFTTGIDDCRVLDNIFLNKAVITYNGIDTEYGYTLDEMSLLKIYEKVFSITKEVIVLAPDHKFDQHSMYPSKNLTDVDCLITDKPLKAKYQKIFDGSDVKILTV